MLIGDDGFYCSESETKEHNEIRRVVLFPWQRIAEVKKVRNLALLYYYPSSEGFVSSKMCRYNIGLTTNRNNLLYKEKDY